MNYDENADGVYTDELAVEDLSKLVAAVTSGVNGAIPEDEDRVLAEKIVDLINNRFDEE